MSPLCHRPLSPPWHRTSLPSPHVSSLAPSPSQHCASPPLVSRLLSSPPPSLHTIISRLLPLPQQPPHSPASTLFQRPLGPRLLSTSRHRPSSSLDTLPPFPRYRSAKQDRTEGLCSALFGRTEALHLIKPIKPNKIAFVQPNRTKQRPSARPELMPGEGALDMCRRVGRRWGPKGGTKRGPVPGSGGCWRRERRRGQRRRGGCWGR